MKTQISNLRNKMENLTTSNGTENMTFVTSDNTLSIIQKNSRLTFQKLNH